MIYDERVTYSSIGYLYMTSLYVCIYEEVIQGLSILLDVYVTSVLPIRDCMRI
jgi:hypothetical protein